MTTTVDQNTADEFQELEADLAVLAQEEEEDSGNEGDPESKRRFLQTLKSSKSLQLDGWVGMVGRLVYV